MSLAKSNTLSLMKLFVLLTVSCYMLATDSHAADSASYRAEVDQNQLSVELLRAVPAQLIAPVRAQDTLRDIASYVRPPKSSIEQVMAAIYLVNPGQFVVGDTARVITDGQLVIPRIEVIQALPQELAEQLLSREAIVEAPNLEPGEKPQPVVRGGQFEGRVYAGLLSQQLHIAGVLQQMQEQQVQLQQQVSLLNQQMAVVQQFLLSTLEPESLPLAAQGADTNDRAAQGSSSLHWGWYVFGVVWLLLLLTMLFFGYRLVSARRKAAANEDDDDEADTRRPQANVSVKKSKAKRK